MHAYDPGVSVDAVGPDAGLTAPVRLRRMAQSLQEVGEDNRAQDLAAGKEQVALTRIRLDLKIDVPQHLHEGVGRVRLAVAADRAYDDDGAEALLAGRNDPKRGLESRLGGGDA